MGYITISWEKYFQLSLDSGLRGNDERGRAVIPGKAAGRDPESIILLYLPECEIGFLVLSLFPRKVVQETWLGCACDSRRGATRAKYHSH
jgi:hypothetical protein